MNITRVSVTFSSRKKENKMIVLLIIAIMLIIAQAFRHEILMREWLTENIKTNEHILAYHKIVEGILNDVVIHIERDTANKLAISTALTTMDAKIPYKKRFAKTKIIAPSTEQQNTVEN